MTEQQWLTAVHPADMIGSLYPRIAVGRRTDPHYAERFRRYAIACLRRIPELLTDDDIRLLDDLDRHCDKPTVTGVADARKRWRKRTAPERWDMRSELDAPSSMIWWSRQSAKYALELCMDARPTKAVSAYWTVARATSGLRAVATGELPPVPYTGTTDPTADDLAVLAALLRDIFGNWRPVTFSPEWRTDTAVLLAKQMYKNREFSAMPILADALQDAGCDDEQILNHCRDANQPRGCWVIDLVLSKAAKRKRRG